MYQPLQDVGHQLVYIYIYICTVGWWWGGGGEGGPNVKFAGVE